MADLKQELLRTAHAVQHFIEQDSFPAQVFPELLRNAVWDYPLRGGKRLRPALLLWTCGMTGGHCETALPAAAAVEIFHNWTLVHDDIIDRDEVRRGQPTAHIQLRDSAKVRFGGSPEKAAAYGISFAILAGDVQQAWAVHTLMRLSENHVHDSVVLALVRRMQTELNRVLISGEALDVEFELHNPDTVSKEDIFRMISGKTSALLRYSMQAGAAIALQSTDFDSPLQQDIGNFAENLGLAFQIQDDLLGLYGDFKTFGKPIASDFQEAKPTILYREAMDRMNSVQRQELKSMLHLPFYGEEEIQKLRTMIHDCGAEDAVRKLSEDFSGKALAILERFPKNQYRDLLKDLTLMLIGRNI